uniref:tRNA(His) guanylyltransferase n=1 Tax=Chromera velia CCMP2878 TaxID=1169474 RepID=A0A0G4G2F5_9ALVE|eukprot:Cvel_19955.t1-p1 / transcript=Cvel_19955.t1 / gene=Cvel_19955 / organism=Chromera_velia_CCMP2878 / gene_product=Probable tRNA(His) guanylyltransferase, putative / transcript_product=Probable tRNA(His) guanylyltransferase, putative / location=Cvel_scaffold1757:434-6303(-) / protein_length=544 / sequence_SO=supercontig / SO=protein_coding / is_pseudo=false
MDLPPELITVWNGFSSGETRLLFLSFDFLVRTLKDRDSLLRSRQVLKGDGVIYGIKGNTEEGDMKRIYCGLGLADLETVTAGDVADARAWGRGKERFLEWKYHFNPTDPTPWLKALKADTVEVFVLAVVPGRVLMEAEVDWMMGLFAARWAVFKSPPLTLTIEKTPVWGSFIARGNCQCNGYGIAQVINRERSISWVCTMACSKYEYVKQFESDQTALPNCWMVVRLDGHCFTEFTQAHGFTKPNDARALQLMNLCAAKVMETFGDVCIAYGQSDEYSFVFRKDCQLWSRRIQKIVTNVVSLFTSAYVFNWPRFFPPSPESGTDSLCLKFPPSFDARMVLYPSDENLKDYLAWRQVDCHINNQYNTCFWALVQSGKKQTEAYEILRGSRTSDKNEILFSQFGINYGSIPPIFRKGSVLIRKPPKERVSREEALKRRGEQTGKGEGAAERDRTCGAGDGEEARGGAVGVISSAGQIGEVGEGNGEGVGEKSSPSESVQWEHSGEESTDLLFGGTGKKNRLLVLHKDIIGASFWTENAHVLEKAKK